MRRRVVALIDDVERLLAPRFAGLSRVATRLPPGRRRRAGLPSSYIAGAVQRAAGFSTGSASTGARGDRVTRASGSGSCVRREGRLAAGSLPRTTSRPSLPNGDRGSPRLSPRRGRRGGRASVGYTRWPGLPAPRRRLRSPGGRAGRRLPAHAARRATFIGTASSASRPTRRGSRCSTPPSPVDPQLRRQWDRRSIIRLEQDADVVIFLYRDEVYNKESPDRGAADVIVAKHRAGPIGHDAVGVPRAVRPLRQRCAARVGVIAAILGGCSR